MSINKLMNLKLDHIYKGYRLLKSTDVPEFKLTALEFIHEKTNAKHIHLDRNDKNKTFAVQFRTPAPNSSGVPHILEHTVLCGSEKYPVRDPFFKMLTRSQATFMNAMTASDWTLYPFSSINNKDFLNLLSVYLDAVFRPKLEEQDFMQEGWRLEPHNFNDLSSDFILKGVVYNEMKGVFSSSVNNLAHQCENNILPKTYTHVSGGTPSEIPLLTHQELKNFHQKLYHPSNSKFFTYGDMNIEDILGIIDSDYLSNFENKSCNTSIGLEPRWTAPRKLNLHCQSDPMAADKDRQNSVVLSFAIDDSRSVYLNFKIGLISSLLLNGDNAPLYQALIESGIGQDWASQLCGFDYSNRTSVFNIGLQGVHNEDIEKVEKIIFKVLDDVLRDGFPQERISSLLHQIELSIRHDDANFGLRLIMGLSSGVNHDAYLEDLLKSTEYVHRIKKELESDPYCLQKLITKYLINNQHRLSISMKSKATFEEEKLAEEQKMIKTINEKLTIDEKNNIAEKCKKLLEAQNTIQNIDCLPCLKINEISKFSEQFPFKLSEDHTLQINEYDTNGIMYLNMFFNLHGIKIHLLPYMPLFSSVVTSMSTSSHHYRDIAQAAESCSGGLNSSLSLSGNLCSLKKEDITTGLLMSSYCLYENFSKVLDLWTNVIKEVQLDDVDRLSTLIKMETSGAWSADGISGSAHHFAMRRAVSQLSPLGRISEIWHGLEQAQFMMKIAKLSLNEIKEQIVPILQEIKADIFNKNRLRMSINLESSAVDSTVSMLDLFKLDMHSKDYNDEYFSINTKVDNDCHFVLPYTVNYVSTAMESVAYQHPDFAKSRILSKLLSSKFLHKQIREIGGAYGSGAVSSPGHFKFYSYRDPHSSETLQKFMASLQWIIKENVDNQLLNEAKLSIFQEIDKPISAGSKGRAYFLDRLTDEMRQLQRERLFEVSLTDVKDVADKLINLSNKRNVVIGPDQNLGDHWNKVLFSE